MRNYWSCTKFADWLRGKPKLDVGTSAQWADWRRVAKSQHPIRYWIAEEFLDKVQNVVMFPDTVWSNIRYYINNRWISRSHALTAHPKDIKPGKWCDVGHRFLPCLFNELVDFVEVETAWHHVLWDQDARKKYRTPWWRVNFLRFRLWRSPQAGVAHLEWASGLTYVDNKGRERPTTQAVAAKEILDLYYWWTEVYPNRPDIHDITGWSAYCDRLREKNDGDIFLSLEDKSKDEQKESKKILNEMSKLEKQYADEDTKMLIRLIRVRESLWT